MKWQIPVLLASVLLCSVVLSSNVMLAQANSDRSISSFGAIQVAPFKLGIYGATGGNKISYFTDLTAEQVAYTYDMSQSNPAGVPGQASDPYIVKMTEVKQLNPAYQALVYRNVLAIHKSWTDEWNTAMINGWLLKDANGIYISTYGGENYMADTTNPAYHQWLANTLKSWLDWYPAVWDGVMLDCCLITSAHIWESGGGGRPINPRTGTYFTDGEVLRGYSQLINAVTAALGPSKLVVPNGIWNGNMFFNDPGYVTILNATAQLNALGSESTYYEMSGVRYYTEAEWKDSIDMIVWVQDNFLNGHPDRRAATCCNVVDLSLPVGTTPEQMAQFGYCSAMLAVKNNQNVIGFGFDLYTSNPTVFALAQKLRNIDIGEPLGNYYKIASASVYARDFAKGKVIVNPTDALRTVTLDKSYTTSDGNVVSGSLTLIPHSGVILSNGI